MARNALGKGLDALISENEYENDISVTSSGVTSNNSDGMFEVDVDQLKPNPYQPRKEFSDESLKELSDSIKEHGVVEPVIVTVCPDGGYFLVGGERRTRAAKLAGVKKIPACVKTYTPQKMLEIALIENVQREDLNPLEEANAYHQLMEMSNLSQDEVAQRVGKNRSTIANSLRLLKLPEDMQNALSNKEITAGHARALLSVVSPSDQRILFARITGSGLSVREAERNATELNGGTRPITPNKKTNTKIEDNRDPDLIAVEQELIGLLGTKVSIRGTLEKGNIQIEYFSADDLNRLYSIMAK